MGIIYKEIDGDLLEKMCSHFGDEETIKKHIHFENGSFSLVALCDDIPVGFISTYTKMLAPPLDNQKDAYIDIIEVDEKYRKQGIASELIRLIEEWAAKNRFSQIRAWSSQDRIEAIPMWYKLGYCMCPAKIWLEWCKQVIDGYYVAKKLYTNKE
ncbi:MAG: GNAT family N-acetyltransferase [Oscillospiraceae bacterium]|nr:GNAT family N-acetyltransferase [Oscillospiraceae bacterium]